MQDILNSKEDKCITLSEAKHYLRVDNNEDDALITSLIKTAITLVEDIIRRDLDEYTAIPEPIKQAILVLIATLYEERQVSTKDGLPLDKTLDIIRRMLFSYRKEQF